jgi:hypothetical protein
MTLSRVVRFLILALFVAFGVEAVVRGGAPAPQEVRVTTGAGVALAPGLQTPMSAVTLNGTGLIVGQVVDAGTGRGVPGAIVALGGSAPPGPTRVENVTQVIAGGGGAAPVVFNSATGPQVPRVLTDAEGRFAFRNVPKGIFQLSATKVGYLDGAYGRLRPTGPTQTLDLAEGERDGDIKIRLFKTAAITGTVQDDQGEPVVGATLRAYRRTLVSGRRVLSPSGATATTDDRGVYRLGSLMPGEYIVAMQTVQSSVPASLQLTGGLPPDLMATLVSAGTANISLSSGGTQVTPDGKFLLQSSGRGSPTALPPSGDGRLLVHPTQYYPAAATVAEAAPITLGSGEERTSIDLQLRLVPTANVSGKLMGPEGPAANWVVHLVPGDSGDLSSDPDVATSITDTNGDFTFLAVPAGQYIIQTIRPGRSAMGGPMMIAGDRMVMTFTAVAPPGGAPPPPPPPSRGAQPTLWAAAPVAVAGADLTGITISLREGINVSGAIQFEGSAEKPPATRLQTITVIVEAADGKQRGGLPTTRLDADGTFTLPGLLPGKYVMRVANPPGGWTFRGAAAGGTDLTDTPFEAGDRDITGVVLTFIDRATEISGSVKGSNGAADADAAVIAFPADNRAWMQYGANPRRMQIRRPSPTGAFSFRALPAGDYYLVAISDEVAGDWQNPQFLDALSRLATRVTIGEGETRTQDLTRQNARPAGGEPVVEPADAGAEPRAHGPFVQQQPPPPTRDPGRLPPPQTPQGPRDVRQLPTTGTATISGQVLIDDSSPQPARRARVTLRHTETRAERAASTDEMGRFVITGVPAGHYSLTATKAAFLTAYYGSKRAGRGPGTPLAIADGQNFSNITLRVTKGAVIAGSVRDDFAQPLANTMVRLQQFQTVNGVRSLVTVPGGQSVSVTDDRGAFRFYGLMPGAYVVMAMPQIPPGLGGELRQLSTAEIQSAVADLQRPAPVAPPAASARPGQPPAPPPAQPGRTVGYAQVFYPGTTNQADAQPVTVAPSQELLGIDFAMRTVPTAKIEGTITGPDGQPASGVQLSLQQTVPGSNAINVSSAGVRTTPDGKFTAPNVTPGHYTLVARAGAGGGGGRGGDVIRGDVVATFAGAGGIATPPTMVMSGGASGLWATTEIDINGEDVSNVSLTLQEGMTVSGRVVQAGSGRAPALDFERVGVTLAPAAQGGGFSASSARVDAQGQFRITGVIPGRYALRISQMGAGPGTPAWYPRSAVSQGKDILDVPLEIRPGQHVDDLTLTMTDQLAEVSGTLMDGAGKPAPGFTILVFSTNREFWSQGARRLAPPTQPASDGKFRVANLAPGEYFMAAVTDLEPGDWGDASFLEAVAAAAFKITLGEGERKVQDLKIAG